MTTEFADRLDAQMHGIRTTMMRWQDVDQAGHGKAPCCEERTRKTRASAGRGANEWVGGGGKAGRQSENGGGWGAKAGKGKARTDTRSESEFDSREGLMTGSEGGLASVVAPRRDQSRIVS